MAATVVGPTLLRRAPTAGTMLVWAVGLFGVAMTLLAPAQALHDSLGLAVILQWCLLGGFFATLYEVPIANTLLSDLPEDLRGRGVGLLHTIGIGFTLVGIALGGLLGATIGVGTSIIVAGATLAVIAVAVLAPYARSATARRPAPADA